MDKENRGSGEPIGHEDKGSTFAAAKDELRDAGEPSADGHHAEGMPHLPVAEPFQGFTSSLPKERPGVFTHLVNGDGDITGLVAYSIYKQNKLDWLSAFQTAKGRDPTDEELASYIIGEGTPRRLATYRHLAEATLAGNGPTGDGSARSPTPRVIARRLPGIGDNPAAIATYAVIALLLLIGFLLAAHYTMSSR